MTCSPLSASQPPPQLRDPLASDAIAFRYEICIVDRQCPSLPHIERRPLAHYFWLKKATIAGKHFASRCNMPETTLPDGGWFPVVSSEVGEKCATLTVQCLVVLQRRGLVSCLALWRYLGT